MDSIFLDPPPDRDNGVNVRVVVTVGDGVDATSITFSERLTPAGAAMLPDVIRQHLTAGGPR